MFPVLYLTLSITIFSLLDLLKDRNTTIKEISIISKFRRLEYIESLGYNFMWYIQIPL